MNIEEAVPEFATLCELFEDTISLYTDSIDFLSICRNDYAMHHFESNCTNSTGLPSIFDLCSEYESYLIRKEKTRFIAFLGSCVTLTFCIVGVLGNGISCAIFFRHSVKSSINILLAGLSLIDLFISILAVPVFVLPGLNEYFQFEDLWRSYPVITFCVYPVIMMFQTASIYIFVLVSAERYFAVCHPLQIRRIVSIKRTRYAQYTVALFAILYNVPRFFEYKNFIEFDDSHQKEAPQRLRNDWYYFQVYYVGMYLVTHFAIPFSVICILNILTAIRLSQANKERRLLSQQQRTQHKTTRMIILVIVTFLITNGLLFVLNIWEALDRHLFDQDNVLHFPAFLLLDLANMLVVANSSTTFIIYLTCCRRYRKEFVALSGWRRRTSRRGSNPSMRQRKRTASTSVGALLVPVASQCNSMDHTAYNVEVQ